jgi:hypothetical protein
MSTAKKSNWHDMLPPGEIVPAGYMLLLLMVALTKSAALTRGIKPNDQLHLLEMMNGLTDQYLTQEMLAMIEPMPSPGWQIYIEAKSLDSADDKLAKASFAVLTSERVFGHFVRLNRSIVEAIRWRIAQRQRSVVAAPATSPTAAPVTPAPAILETPAPPVPPMLVRPMQGYEIPDRFMQRGPGR